MKSSKYYSYYKVNKITNNSYFSWEDNSFVFPDLCYCGHWLFSDILLCTIRRKKETNLFIEFLANYAA
jgi:hypothetical protein